jgi:Regulator of chromosome condensation (RCC1) repeat
MSQVACGSSFMVALSEGGDLFAWGDNRCVQLGVSASAPVTPCARPYSGAGTGYPGSPPILQSYFSPSSSSQSPFTSDSGRVEASRTGAAPCDPEGNSLSTSTSQLSNSISTDLKTVMSCRPVLIESLRQVRVTAVACGALHSLCVSEEGQVYSWGRAAGGRLGQLPDRVGIPDNAVGRPALVRSSWETIDFDLFPPSSKPSPEPNMLSARMEDYYSFSSAAVNGVQPYETESDHDSIADERTSQRRPTTIPFFKGGRDSRPSTTHIPTTSSSSSTYIQTSQEMLNSFPPTPRASSPSSLNRVVCISAGFRHSLAVTACGGVFSWGCGTHGRLGHGSHCDEYLPRQVTLRHFCSSCKFLCTLFDSSVQCCSALCCTALYCLSLHCIVRDIALRYVQL